MGVLGSTTALAGRTGRKLNNTLTLTFKTSADDTLAVATQAKSIGVLFGFRNGGPGRYAIEGDGGELAVDCAKERTTVTTGAGVAIGTVEPSPERAVFQAADGTVLAHLRGQPAGQQQEPAWTYTLTDAAEEPLGTLVWVRTTGRVDLLAEATDLWLFWDHAGASLKVPSLGVQLALDHPVEAALGDLLLAACVDVSLGAHSYICA